MFKCCGVGNLRKERKLVLIIDWSVIIVIKWLNLVSLMEEADICFLRRWWNEEYSSVSVKRKVNLSLI